MSQEISAVLLILLISFAPLILAVISGLRAFPNVVAYNMSKAAVDHLVRTCALEVASQGVRGKYARHTQWKIITRPLNVQIVHKSVHFYCVYFFIM